MTNDEMTNETQMTNDENAPWNCRLISAFVLRHSFVLRPSCFVIHFIPRDRRGHASITPTNLLYCLRVRPLVARRQLPRPLAQLHLCATRSASPRPQD